MSDHPFRTLLADLTPIPTDVSPRLTALANIRAVIFDVYGTLVISGSGDVGSADSMGHADALQQAVAAVELGVVEDPQTAWEQFQATISEHHANARARGVSFPEVDILAVWRDWLQQHQGLADPDVASVRQLSLQYEAFCNPACLMPEANTTLAGLLDRGQKLGIVSNAQFFTLDLLEITLGKTPAAIGFAPDLCVFSYRYGHAKPGDLLFDSLVSALSRIGIAPSEALYVGNDMLNDVYAAQKAGLKTALFAGDRRSLRMRKDDSRVTGCDADIVLTSLGQLMDVVSGS